LKADVSITECIRPQSSDHLGGPPARVAAPGQVAANGRPRMEEAGRVLVGTIL